jgi:hypothetical protein
MSHLSTLKSQSAMVFYSLLTFFIVPYFTTPLLPPGGGPNKCIVGFTVGFLISIFLWYMFGEMLTTQ